MLTREELEEREQVNLASYAVKANHSKGRKFDEPHHPYRTCFQRDRDRIIFSAAFRRLQYKTQVFSNFEGDYYRTRLTHTLEVSQLSKSIARGLALNEDLAESIALAHDLGHGPFGHIGETILSECMNDNGGFEHNIQSCRVVQELEDVYSDGKGLNLSFETIEGLKKHTFTTLDKSVPDSYATLEAQVVDFADAVAYDCHDLDDGLNARLLTFEDVAQLKIVRRIITEYKADFEHNNSFYKVRVLIRRLINYLVTDLLLESERRIVEAEIKSVDDLIRITYPLIGFSKEVEVEKNELELFLKKDFYNNTQVVKIIKLAEKCIKGLFNIYIENPNKMPKHFFDKVTKYPNEKFRIVCDYLAGMTDRYVFDEYYRITMANC